MKLFLELANGTSYTAAVQISCILPFQHHRVPCFTYHSLLQRVSSPQQLHLQHLLPSSFICRRAPVFVNMGLLRSSALLAALPFAFAQSGTNSSTSGPFNNPGAVSGQTSPPKYPSPWGEGLGDWDAAYAQAREFVSQLTLLEKVNLTTGVGWEGEKCVGNTGAIPRLGFKALCLQDSPLGVRFADYVSAFPAGVTIGATWDRNLFHLRGHDMGVEHREKGIDVQLGPAIGPIGRHPAGGRNWEGFSPDPVLSGIGVYETVKGIQEAGVIACTKHYIANEQEHFRQGGPNVSEAISSNLDDVTLVCGPRPDESRTVTDTFSSTSFTFGRSPMPCVLALVPSCALTTRSTTATLARTPTSKTTSSRTSLVSKDSS